MTLFDSMSYIQATMMQEVGPVSLGSSTPMALESTVHVAAFMGWY